MEKLKGIQNDITRLLENLEIIKKQQATIEELKHENQECNKLEKKLVKEVISHFSEKCDQYKIVMHF